METKIEVKEQDLFKIKTLKKKHAEQIRDTYLADKGFDFGTVEVLGEIDVWSAVLIREPGTGRFRVKSATLYADWLMRTQGLEGTVAYQKVNELPQLFLD